MVGCSCALEYGSEYTYIEFRKHTVTFPGKSKTTIHEINTKRIESIATNHVKREMVTAKYYFLVRTLCRACTTEDYSKKNQVLIHTL